LEWEGFSLHMYYDSGDKRYGKARDGSYSGPTKFAHVDFGTGMVLKVPAI
jgi:hypothetical protein